MFSLQLHKLLALIMHSKASIAEDLLKLSNIDLLAIQVALLRMNPLEHVAHLLRLKLPLKPLLLEGIYSMVESMLTYLASSYSTAGSSLAG